MDHPRGIKRKRPEVSPETKFGTKLFHTIKEVQQTAKKARSFETQRVVKKINRLKNAADDDARSNLSAELTELKAVDTPAFASATLRARLLKDSHICSNDAVRIAIESQLPISSAISRSLEAERVRNRIASNRTFAKVLGDAVSSLRAILVPPTETESQDLSKAPNNEDEQDDEQEESTERSDVEDDTDRGTESAIGEEEQEEQADDGWESGSVHSDGDSDEEDLDNAPPPSKKAKPAVSSKAKTPSAPTQSQFLPSLAVGYIPGSDSDGDDIDEIDTGRKNRRGQRARRAIWEKKYGRGANHKKKEAAEAQAKMQKKANRMMKSSRDNGRLSSKPWQKQQPPHYNHPPHHPPATVTKPAPQTPAAGLHPSWAAKRALKEKGATGIVPSQGKKIVFD
ncbi:hypothetical protein MIND_00859500 [Mycena indigotica]|uniref:Bud22 domain-containing protein n=1 Tax=Mycena indigotica TaxID=2126181 RepID=A0A8H6SIT5_9AGAR|nr:uncharacterized protein MIND_00859500 [Mycena indigotica]KAF7299112.1 hypothetical protein MIND_00859500 [Mycena indigotica]